jgi:oligopeptide/dipeptide ABC transporter ATP-binding protein
MFELQAERLVKHFSASEGRTVYAVDQVDLEFGAGETVGLVGESGCGKSTFGLLLLGLLRPTSGAVRWNGTPLGKLSRRELMAFRRQTSIVFQDPMSSLDPRMSIRRIVEEPIVTHDRSRGRALHRRALDLLDRVGIDPSVARRHPHEFSGGQRQRIAIARALALHPKFVVFDEPTSALDVSVQAQVLNLVRELRSEFGIGYVFISHNLPVVRLVAERVVVMYLGKVAEQASTEAVFANPQHPYTKALLASIPDPRARDPEVPIRTGDPPSAAAPPTGCRYHTRCPWVFDRCPVEEPELIQRGGTVAACHLLDDDRDDRAENSAPTKEGVLP